MPFRNTLHVKNPRIKKSHREPYWNFWRVVFAGWLIRYPGVVFRIACVPLGIMIVWIHKLLTS